MSNANNFEEILLAFTKYKVEFMLAGGYAVNFHGYNRSTSDMDIWINPSETNKKKIYTALISIGFPPEQLSPVLEIDFTKPFACKIGAEPIDIDVFNFITGVKYEEAEKNMIPFKYSDTLTVYYIHIRDLIVNKMLTGRPKDKADVEMLHKIMLKKK